MAESALTPDYDVAIVGGGPAGLSAAVVLGRSRRRVVVFDDGKPRNYAAQGVHCYLGQEGIEPNSLRELGRNAARHYGVELLDAKVVAARRIDRDGDAADGFELQTSDRSFIVRALLLCTGLMDGLPDIPNLREFYGRSVHHCPYCDGWEHRDKRLAALGDGEHATKLALSLLTWSRDVTACTNGEPLAEKHRRLLDRHGVTYREEPILRLQGVDGTLEEIMFTTGPSLKCDAVFFSSDKVQRSPLPAMLGCELDDEGLARTGKRQTTCINGLYLAGDADGDAQFAIVAAAEGAIAGTAINAALQKEELSADD
ncbi:MAG TPA: NAD(P)/FAD-dependent oxidoreductase [Lacipirellulaceae bacterium]|nr:NAD(P)/FAD-dependent oxidoreductase [Lacipirellulaceae bacterium]